MRHGDLKMLFIIALVTGALYFGVESGALARSASHAAATASGALAYWDDEDDFGSPIDPYYDEPYAEAAYYGRPDALDDDADEADEYWSGPYYWADADPVYEDPYESAAYYDPYLGDIVIDDTPWYVDAFPGIGQTFTYLLPPIATSRPIVQPPTPPRPTCSIQASPATIPYGGSTVVSWSANNSARAVLSGVGDVPGTGSRAFSGLTAPQTYALSVSGLGGSSTCSTTVYVQQGDVTPSCQISTNPASIRRGESANLAWTSQNAESARLSGEGSVSQTGGRIISPVQSATYTLIVTSRTGRSASCAATLSVL